VAGQLLNVFVLYEMTSVTRKQKLKQQTKYFRQQCTKKIFFLQQVGFGAIKVDTKFSIKCILKRYSSKQRIKVNFGINNLIIKLSRPFKALLPKNI
jgi:hypothetical protein